jgi:hypothetical protein
MFENSTGFLFSSETIPVMELAKKMRGRNRRNGVKTFAILGWFDVLVAT